MNLDLVSNVNYIDCSSLRREKDHLSPECQMILCDCMFFGGCLNQ